MKWILLVSLCVFVSAREKELVPNMYRIQWEIQRDLIDLWIHAQTLGWIGFGIAEAGGMAGSDILYTTQSTTPGQVQLVDAFALSQSTPVEDDCADWKLLQFEQVNGSSSLHVQRKLDTHSDQDRPIRRGTRTKIIVAWGDSLSFSYHGQNRRTFSVNFFQEDANVDALKASKDVLSFDITNAQVSASSACDPRCIPIADPCYSAGCDASTGTITKPFLEMGCSMAVSLCGGCYPESPCGSQTATDADPDGKPGLHVPQKETTYWEQCKDIDEAFDGSQIIGYEFIEDPRTIGVLHHFVVTGYFDSDHCEGNHITIWLWGPGVTSWELPQEAGIRIGPDDFMIKSINIQSHFDNPSLSDAFFDDSGVRFFTTTKLRPYDAGVFQLGDPNVRTKGEIPMGYSFYEYQCPGSCTADWDVPNVTIFASGLHMHELGAKMWTDHYLPNETKKNRAGLVEYFDFDFQDSISMQPYTVQRGESFVTRCYYHQGAKDLLKHDQRRHFGLGSSDEMCIDFLFYYPVSKKTNNKCGLGTCGGKQIQHRPLSNVSELDRVFGSASDSGCQKEPAQRTPPNTVSETIRTTNKGHSVPLNCAPREFFGFAVHLFLILLIQGFAIV